MKMIRCNFFRSVLAAGLLSFAGAVFAGETVDFEKENGYLIGVISGSLFIM